MKRVSAMAVLAVAVSIVALPASAKGAFEATITGPGIDEPIALDGRQSVNRQDGRLQRLMEVIAFWDLVYADVDSPHRPDGIATQPPTTDLGTEYTVTIGHFGPGGEVYVDVLAYPHAEGGPLVYVEPGLEIDEARTTTSGGWYRTPAELGAMFEEYGAEMVEAEKKAAVSAADSPAAAPLTPASEPAGILLALALLGSVSLLLVQVLRKRRRDGLV